jgi:hypothetical protein
MDSKLNWDPDEYGGVEQLIVPSELLWLPDILLYTPYLQQVGNWKKEI